MMSNRPAEHSDGDRSTRNAAFGAEIIRFRAIRGHLGPERIITGLRARTRQLPLEFGKYKLNPRLGIDGCHG